MQDTRRVEENSEVRASRLSRLRGSMTGYSGRKMREYLAGYLMILPATILIFVFGIFPVGFALYVSVHQWKLRRGDFIGIENYTRAIDNLIYVLLFASGGRCACAGLGAACGGSSAGHSNAGTRPWVMALPGAVHAATIIAFLRWTVLLLPNVLDIANKVIAVERTRASCSSSCSEKPSPCRKSLRPCGCSCSCCLLPC